MLIIKNFCFWPSNKWIYLIRPNFLHERCECFLFTYSFIEFFISLLWSCSITSKQGESRRCINKYVHLGFDLRFMKYGSPLYTMISEILLIRRHYTNIPLLKQLWWIPITQSRVHATQNEPWRRKAKPVKLRISE